MFTVVLPSFSFSPVPGPGTRPARAAAGSLMGALLALCLAGCGTDTEKGPGVAPVVSAAVGLAILASDFAVTTVSLYNPATGALTDACVHSGPGGGVLAQPLSGDVTLPSQAQHGGELVLVDRKNAVLTFVDPTTCVARGQISVSTGGFKANPRDVISVSAGKAYVTRFETNASPTADAADFDEGDDVLVIDPQATQPGAAVLKRIPLASYATSVPGRVIQARPDRGLLADGKVYVTLGNLSRDFMAAGAGRVVIIDPATDAVVGTVDLPAGQKGCAGLDYVPATKRLYVSCGGSFSDDSQAAGSGLVEIDLTATLPTAKVVVAADLVGDQSINFAYAAVLDGTAFVGTLGTSDFMTGAVIVPDAFYAVDLAGGTATKLLDGGAFNFGRAIIDAARKRVLLPDGDAVVPRVHIFDAAVTPPVATDTLNANPGAGLPPREVAWY